MCKLGNSFVNSESKKLWLKSYWNGLVYAENKVEKALPQTKEKLIAAIRTSWDKIREDSIRKTILKVSTEISKKLLSKKENGYNYL